MQPSTHCYHERPSGPLELDYYQAEQGDGCLLVYVHGGAFAHGSRQEAGDIPFYTFLASNGISVASISYRLLLTDFAPLYEQDPLILIEPRRAANAAAVNDLRAAVCWLLDAGHDFDPDKIVLMGCSAGANAVCQEVFWPVGLHSDGGPCLADDFRYGGLISCAGAMLHPEVLDPGRFVPALFFHGTDDDAVAYYAAPYGNDRRCDLRVGSRYLCEEYEAAGASYVLHSMLADDHRWAGMPQRNRREVILAWLQRVVVGGERPQEHHRIDCRSEAWND